MRRSRSLLELGGLAAASAGALTACAPPEPRRDIAYYRDHPDARAQMIAACHNDRGKVKTDSNCINALAADSEATSKAFWTVPRPASRVTAPGKL